MFWPKLLFTYVMASVAASNNMSSVTDIEKKPKLPLPILIKSFKNGAPPTHQVSPVVKTPSGIFRGSWMETRRNRRFEAYRGIRYAEPPTGNLRFQAPKPILYHKGVFDASKAGPICPMQGPLSALQFSEDCLRLNVFTPSSNRSQLMPVIFFIHAGRFFTAIDWSDNAGPHYLLDRDLVLVTISFRTGSLGFLSTGDKEAPGNYGMKDQVAALRWVQRNIASFGGDPNLVTIAGCSLGSISVLLHMVSPMSKGLFHRGISMSASPVGKGRLKPHQRHLATWQAKLLGCYSNSTKIMIACLKERPWQRFSHSLPLDKIQLYNITEQLGQWSYVVEPDVGQERFLDMDPTEAIRGGRLQSVPYIIGQTTGEFFWKGLIILQSKSRTEQLERNWETLAPTSLMLPREGSAVSARRLKQVSLGGRSLSRDSACADGLGNLFGDSIVAYPVHTMAKLMCRHSHEKVFYYEFAYVGNSSHYKDPVTRKPVGAAHQDDLLYLFTMVYHFPPITVMHPDTRMVDKMTTIFFNFARNGDPNPTPEISWPPMTPEDRKYLRIDRQFTVRKKLKEDRLRVWEELYPLKY